MGNKLEKGQSSNLISAKDINNELKKKAHRISWIPYVNLQPLTIENGINLVEILPSQPKIAKVRSKEIDKMLKEEKKELAMLGWKILLLGPASSGKSTLLRQMRLIHCGGFTGIERDIFKQFIYTNIIQNMKKLVQGVKNLQLETKADASYEEILIKFECDEVVSSPPPANVKQAISGLWNHEFFKDFYNKHGNELNIQETAAYYFNHLPRIWGPDYSPTDQDIIYTRKATESISETSIIVKKERLRVFDVGGHKHLRMHWLPYFDDVKAIVFVASISSYNQVMEEDHETNRIIDAILLFDQIVNNPVFAKTAVILLLNKMDLFEEKIKTVHVKDYFPSYVEQEGDVEAAKLYFKRKFERTVSKGDTLQRSPMPAERSRQIFTHFTTNTNTKLTRVIIDSVCESVIKQELNSAGLI